MFSAVLYAQRNSANLMVYSRTVGSMVTLAWPTRQGIPIVPKGIKGFLDGKGTFWECCCGILSTDARPCRIAVSRKTGHVMVFCHSQEGGQCGFFMNLTEKAETATLFSDYGHLPSARSGFRGNMGPYILAHRSQAALSETAPLFEGYLGEFSLDHGGVKQLNSGIKYVSSSKHPKIESPTCVNQLYKRQTSASQRSIIVIPSERGNEIRLDIPARHSLEVALSTIAGTTSDGPNDAWVARLEDLGGEQHLERLRKGEGLTLAEFEGLIELCNACKRYFTPKALREHIPRCNDLQG